MDNIEWLNFWYSSNCNGEWEDTYGVKIDTLNNPGWWLKIDLVDTEHEGRVWKHKEATTENDWYSIDCDGKVFEAFGDTTKLALLIQLFRKFIEEAPVV